MITLKEFVKETLSQIVEGASEFSAENGPDGPSTNPQVGGSIKSDQWAGHGLIFLGFDERRVSYATVVEFDVAVSATDAETAKGGGGIRVFSVLSADGSHESQASNSTVSRMRFKLPLQIHGVGAPKPIDPRRLAKALA